MAGLEGSKGPLVADFAALRVVTTRHSMPGPEVWVLFRRAVGDPAEGAGEEPEVKIYLSNAPTDLPLSEVVRVSGMRWPIESCFAEGKGDVGLDHDEVRSWRGWRHHMTLVILAHHVLVRMRQRLNQRGGARGAPRAPGAAGVPGPAHGAPPPARGSRRVEPDPRASAAAGGATTTSRPPWTSCPTSSSAKRPPLAPIARVSCANSRCFIHRDRSLVVILAGERWAIPWLSTPIPRPRPTRPPR